AAGNRAVCAATMTVADTTAPTLSCPAAITKNADAGQCSTVVTYTTPTASDNCAGATVRCTPASGTAFPVGTTTVTCTATDASNNTAQCSFTVTVLDRQAPAITCPAPITVQTSSNSGTAVTYPTPAAADNCGGTVTVSCTPASGTVFPLGTTTVT